MSRVFEKVVPIYSATCLFFVCKIYVIFAYKKFILIYRIPEKVIIKMWTKILSVVVFAAYLTCIAAIQNGIVVIPFGGNYTVSQSCISGKVALEIDYRSTGSVQFITFDYTQFSTCNPNLLPAFYPTLSTASSVIVADTVLNGLASQPNLCLAFINNDVATVTLTYQFNFICKL